MVQLVEGGDKDSNKTFVKPGRNLDQIKKESSHQT